MADNTTTIRDLLIAPYEIDVDQGNFTVVEITVSAGGKVAGKETEAGKKVRKVVGYYSTLKGCLSRIANEKASMVCPELEGQIVSLKQFLAKQEQYKKLFITWAKYLDAPFTVTEEDGIPVVTPKQVLINSGAKIEKGAE